MENEKTIKTPCDFSDALIALKNRHRLSRAGWNGKGQFIQVQFPDENSKMGAPYIYISTVDKVSVPWIASHGDLFATDWEIV